jgi:catechol-2,3-dioxygenase
MRLLEVALLATDLEEMRRFYCGILGLREVRTEWPGSLDIEAGRTLLTFLPAPGDWRGRYHFAFDVPPDRLDEAAHWLRQRRGLMTGPDGQNRFHSEKWNADNVYFTDPQGNVLELIARRELRQAEAAAQPASRPFTAGDIVAITEIGLAVDSVADAVATLREHMPGIGVYSGAGDDRFAAVGDAHGLLIVALRGRIWYPNTGVPAEPLMTHLLLELENGKRYRLSAPPFPFAISPAS